MCERERERESNAALLLLLLSHYDDRWRWGRSLCKLLSSRRRRRPAGAAAFREARASLDALSGGHAFLSARTLLRAVVDPGRETFDYLELADVLPELSARPTADLRELWRRIAFGCLVQNTDDHMRNHAFVRVGDGWRLSPAFDVNTDPGLGLTSATSVDGEAGPGKLEALVRSADYFRLTEPAARTLLAELAESVASSLDGVLASFASTRTAERLREIISARVGEAR